MGKYYGSKEDVYAKGKQSIEGFLKGKTARGFNNVIQGVMAMTYNAGFEDGVEKTLQEHDFATPCAECEDGYNLGYDKGLKDAWECARKITLATSQGGFSWIDLENIFGSCCDEDIFGELSASEVIEKIKVYYAEKDKIQVGDEVVYNNDGGYKWIVTSIGEYTYRTINELGYGNCINKDEVHKTGRHFDIENIFEQMREEQ